MSKVDDRILQNGPKTPWRSVIQEQSQVCGISTYSGYRYIVFSFLFSLTPISRAGEMLLSWTSTITEWRATEVPQNNCIIFSCISNRVTCEDEGTTPKARTNIEMQKIGLPLQQSKMWAMTEAMASREMKSEFTSLSCKRARSWSWQELSGFTGVRTQFSPSFNQRRLKKEQLWAEADSSPDLSPTKQNPENGRALSIGSRSTILCRCDYEASSRHGRCCLGASLCLTHVFPIDSWRQPSGLGLAWQSRIEVQTEYGFKAVRKRTGMLFRKFFRHGQGLGCNSAVGKSDWGSFWTRAGPAHTHTRRAERRPPGRAPGLWAIFISCFGKPGREVGHCEVLAFSCCAFSACCRFARLLSFRALCMCVCVCVYMYKLELHPFNIWCGVRIVFLAPSLLQDPIFSRAEILWKVRILLPIPMWEREVAEFSNGHPPPTFCNLSAWKDTSLAGQIIMDETVFFAL